MPELPVDRAASDEAKPRLITLLGGAAGAWPLSARAQQSAMPVIGFMTTASAATSARNLAAFRNGLRELGYTDGRNYRIEYRFAEGVAERYSALIADLVTLKPAVILVGSVAAVLAARAVTLLPRRYCPRYHSVACHLFSSGPLCFPFPSIAAQVT
jgi:hypothetical protein